MDFGLSIITNDSRDWYVLYTGGKIFYEGHSIPHWVWIEALSNIGVEVGFEIISDERMENGAF